MKLLWVKTNPLHPLNSGGTIRTFNMLRALRARNNITYLTLESKTTGNPERLASQYSDRLIQVPWRGAPARTDWRFYPLAFANLWSNRPLALDRYIVPALRERLRMLTRNETFDVVVCDFLFPATHFDGVIDTPTLLFQHNVETLIWERLAEQSGGIVSKYYTVQAKRMRHWEGALARTFDHVVTVSRDDAELMRSWFELDGITPVPTGVDTSFYRPSDITVSARDIVFVGSLDWLPNIDGVEWFLKEVWPRILDRKPTTRFHIVGRRPSGTIKRLVASHPGTVLWPDVADVREHVWPARAVIVPLRIGGGTRLKIFEALACGKAVVSTPVGAEGLPLEHGAHILLAAEASAFADAVLSILADASLGSRLGIAGRTLVEREYSWQRAAEAFEDVCRAIRSLRMPIA